MKRLSFLVFLVCSFSNIHGQFRYLDEIFTSVDVTTNVTYGTNYNFLLGTPTPGFNLQTDIFQPTGDAETMRACVIVLHDGNFLPKYLNQTPIGNNKDSAIVVTSEMFAKRGYVAMAPAYRLGWSPTSVDPVEGFDIRKGTLLNAVYRALNDVKALVRYIRKTVAEDGNPYGIDPNNIIIYGHGSGGYLSFAYGSLNRMEEIENAPGDKWLSSVDVPAFEYVQGEPYIDTTEIGNIDGFGGVYNDTNHFGYSNDVLACINAGGALLDSNWIEVGEPPIISFHCSDDGYAPFTNGLVIVPTTSEVVVDVVGSRWAVGRANTLGNNDEWNGSQPYTDIYTLAAEDALQSNHPTLGLIPADYHGLFPFNRPIIPWPFQEAAPWDWWDDATVLASAAPLLSAQGAQDMLNNANSGNPDMSAAKGRAYLDTIHGYMAPRLFEILELCPPTTSTTVATSCNSYAWNGQTYTQTGSYSYQTTNSNGCDSIANLDLTITPNYQESETHHLCAGASITINNVTYTQAGQYNQFFPGNDCDTIVTIDITQEQSPTISILGNTNISPNSGEDYAFVNPGGFTITWSAVNGTIINGQGSPLATIFWDATGGGEVTVTLTNNNCTYSYTIGVGIFVGIEDHWLNSLTIHPNPSSGIFNIDLTEPTAIRVFDATGRVVLETQGNGQFSLDMKSHPVGSYMVQFVVDSGVGVKRVVKY